jgi:hypothetical protein
MVFSRKFTLKNAPNPLIVFQRFLQAAVPILRIPVVLAFFEFHGRFGENRGFDFTAGLGGFADGFIRS